MKSKPIIMEHLKMAHTSFVVDFSFDTNITILTGEAGTGKSRVFSFIREYNDDEQIVCINYQNHLEEIKNIITGAEDKLLIIDNADILLDDDIRKYISIDDKNQYLIIGRNPRNLFATKDNMYELVNEKKGEQIEFRMQPYL